MDFTDKQCQLLKTIGVALLHVQATERVIKLCMTVVLQKDSPLTIEKLEQQEKEELKRTLGYFLAELRKRADIEASFDKTLRDFLENRNTFVHRLSDIPRWDFGTGEGLQAGLEFTSQLIRESTIVQHVFVGLIRAWEEQVGSVNTVPPEGRDYFAMIDAEFMSLADEIFHAKHG